MFGNRRTQEAQVAAAGNNNDSADGEVVRANGGPRANRQTVQSYETRSMLMFTTRTTKTVSGAPKLATCLMAEEPTDKPPIFGAGENLRRTVTTLARKRTRQKTNVCQAEEPRYYTAILEVNNNNNSYEKWRNQFGWVWQQQQRVCAGRPVRMPALCWYIAVKQEYFSRLE